MRKFGWIGVFAFLFWGGAASAQMFQSDGALTAPSVAEEKPVQSSEEEPSPQPAEAENETIDQITKAFATTQQNAADANKEESPLDLISQAMNSAQEDSLQPEISDTEGEDVFVPEGELYRLDTPTQDGSKRGGQAFVEVDDEGRMKKADKIFLFYDNFKMTSYLSNTAGCDVRFNVLSNLDRKINQLDIKLVWPGLTTTLSFSNVSPNTQTYYNYALLGNGCYNMEKAPNIIVNRCRVKGMTSSECANRLVWLMK